MPLHSCPDCGNENSSLAKQCPRCGRPLGSAKGSWLIIIAAALGLLILGVVAFAFMFSSRIYRVDSSAGVLTTTPTEKSVATPAQSPASEVSRPTLTPTPEESFLDIEAAIIYQLGGAQPLARETFYLLNTDLESILRKAGVKPAGETGLIGTFGLIQDYPLEGEPPFETVMLEISRRTVDRTTTNLQGKGRFERVRPGSYYLFGMTKTRGGFAIWNTPVTLQPGANSLIIDNKNAATAF